MNYDHTDSNHSFDPEPPLSALNPLSALQDGLESGHPGTDDGRFYFHLGDALQRMGDDSVS